MGVVGREIKKFDVTAYSGVDLERLGKSLVGHVIRHFGMIRYVRSGIKVYDLTDTEVGKLSDCVMRLYKGVDRQEGLTIYRKDIQNLLEVVMNLNGENVKGSVVSSLRMAVADEVKIFSRELIDFEELWEL